MISKRRPGIPSFVLLFVVVSTLASAFSPISTRAADEPTGFRNVILYVYPEYDDPLRLGSPSVLVMVEGEIAGTQPPAPVRFLVPEGAQMFSAGSGPRDKYQGGPPNRRTSDIEGWDEISYELKTNIFVVEYYLRIPEEPDRMFTAKFIPLYPISGLAALVQQPRRAKDFKVSTDGKTVSQRQFTDGEGFSVQRFAFGTLNVSEPLSFNISYNKTSRAPSLGGGRGNSNTLVLVILGIMAAATILFVSRRYLVPKPAPTRRHLRPGAATGGQVKKPAVERFCPKCGTRVDLAQRFCSKCGTRQRH